MRLAVGIETKRTSFRLRALVLLYIGKEGGQGEREKNLISWPYEEKFRQYAVAACIPRSVYTFSSEGTVAFF